MRSGTPLTDLREHQIREICTGLADLAGKQSILGPTSCGGKSIPGHPWNSVSSTYRGLLAAQRVPFLNRAGSAPNGMLVGRERLVAGDRLVRPLETDSRGTCAGREVHADRPVSHRAHADPTVAFAQQGVDAPAVEGLAPVAALRVSGT